MARPEKEIDQKRTITARFRLTAAEAMQLDKAAIEEGLSLSDYLRAKALNAKPRVKPKNLERTELIKYLGNLGNIRADINQILKDRWAGKFVKPEQVSNAFASIEEIADRIHNTLSNDN